MRQILLAAALLGLTSGAYAAGDAKAGEAKAYTCTGCHGIPGYKNAYPNYHVPKIGGQNYDYLVVALKGYRAGERKHPTMRVQAESMTDQDIEDIATYLSSIQVEEQP